MAGTVLMLLVLLALVVAYWPSGSRAERASLAGLSEFATGLRGGLMSGFGAAGFAVVRGSRERRQLRLEVHARPALLRYQLWCQHGLGAFDLGSVGWAEQASERLGLTGPVGERAGESGRYVVRGGCARGKGALLQREALRSELAHLFGDLGLTRVVLADGILSAERRGFSAEDVAAARFEQTFAALARLAAVCERQEITVNLLEGGRKFGWTGGAAEVLCPYCREAIRVEQARPGELSACSQCATVHHTECLEEAGSCTIFGCGGGAPLPARRA